MKPYLSIVMGIGGDLTSDLLARLQSSIDNLNALARQFRLDAELIVVEWNMPEIFIGLTKLVDFKKDVPTRIIHTPRSLHAQAFNPHGFRYFEWYPKNIGIRRARGEFVLSTNPDDLFSPAMIQFLASKKLEHGKFYRAHRHDTQAGKVYRICRETGCFPPDTPEEFIRSHPAKHAAPWSENMIHYNASGDFTLMGRAEWKLIHGNPEREYNHSVDGQTLWQAHLNDLQQVVLPYPIYHPDHARTLNHAFAPEWDDCQPHSKKNDHYWGFAGMEFQETVI